MTLQISTKYTSIKDVETVEMFRNVIDNLESLDKELKKINNQLELIDFQQRRQDLKINELETA